MVKQNRAIFHYSLLVFLGCLALTYLLSEAYLEQLNGIDKVFARPLILAIGSLFSIASGLLMWSLESRDQFLEREVQKRTLELESKNKELSEKNREIENFIHIVSHDLKAPLVSIQGFASILKGELGNVLQGTNADYFNRIVSNAKQMSVLLQDLLEFSRIGRIEDEAEEVDLNSLFREILAELKPEIDRKKVRVENSENFPKLKGSRKRLHQIFSNLIGNSVKYASKKESPSISLRLDHEDARFVEVSIRDNGIGIPKEAHEKVFQIFQRFHPNSGVEGTGVGLSIVKKIVETYGGKVWFESEPGRGTIFFVAWPKN